MDIVKKIFKWYLIVCVILSYAMVYVIMWLFTGLSADFSTNVGLWGEFFTSEERRRRDKIHQQDLQQYTNWMDKFFIAIYRALKNW